MYAVIRSGGKQYRVEEGEQLEVELLGAAGEVELSPVLVVDGDRVLATPDGARGGAGERQSSTRPAGRRSRASRTSRRPTNGSAGAPARQVLASRSLEITAGGSEKAPAEKKARRQEGTDREGAGDRPAGGAMSPKKGAASSLHMSKKRRRASAG